MHSSFRYAVLGALLLSACATQTAPAPAPEPAAPEPPTSAVPAPNNLANTRWRLETLAGSPPVEGSAPTLEIAANARVSGTTGCNRYFGSYRPDLQSFGDLGSTRMGCAPPLMTQEQTFLSILSGARSAVVGGDGLLTITGGDGRRAIFAPAASGS